jgi:hypothetical protein
MLNGSVIEMLWVESMRKRRGPRTGNWSHDLGNQVRRYFDYYPRIFMVPTDSPVSFLVPRVVVCVGEALQQV